MKLERIRHNWHEKAGMRLDRPDGSGDYVLLHFLTSVTLWFDGQSREAPAGSLIVFSPSKGHGFYSQGALLHDWMHLTGDVEAALQAVGLQPDTLYHMAQSLQVTERIARLEAEFFARSAHWEMCVEVLLGELWITIARQATGEISQPVLKETAGHLRELRALMIQHPEWAWTNEMMAKHVSISVSRLYPLYRRLFSISPGRDLILMRVEKAKNMLNQGVSVAQVTELLGYGSTFHFIRQFKQETGVTPGKWAVQKGKEQMRRKEHGDMKKEYTELLKKTGAWIEAHQEEFVSELRGLVRIPSVSRAAEAQPGAPFGAECRRVLDEMLERGRYYGFDVQDHDGYAVSVSMGDPVNSIGMIAHLDVVPVGDGWVYPPFDVTHLPEHDALIGRGVSDNKGAAVMGLFAMRMLRELNWPLKHGLRLIGGSSEETGMQDMKHLVESGVPFPKISLVPDAAFPVNYAQKGSVDAELTMECRGNLIRLDAGSVRNVIPDLAQCTVAAEVSAVQNAMDKLDDELKQRITIEACAEGTKIAAHGRAGHAASPAGCVNAIAVLTAALGGMEILEGGCAKTIKEVAELTADGFGISEGIDYEDEESGKLTLVYGVAHLKDGILTLSADCRYSVTLEKADLSRRMQESWRKRGFGIAHFEATDPFYLPKNDARVVALQELYKEVTGRDDEPYSMGGGTYSRAAPNALSFGPGLRGVEHDMSFLPEGHGGGHGRDEVMFMQDVRTGFQIYAVALTMLDELTE